MQVLFLHKNNMYRLYLPRFRGIVQEESIVVVAFLITVISFLSLFVFFVQNYRKNISNKQLTGISIINAKGLSIDNKLYKIIIDIKGKDEPPSKIAITFQGEASSTCTKDYLIRIKDDLYGCVSANNFKSTNVSINNKYYFFYMYINENGKLTLLESLHQNGKVSWVTFEGLVPCSRKSSSSICCLVARMAEDSIPFYHYIIASPIVILEKLSKNTYRIYVLVHPTPLKYLTNITMKIYYNKQEFTFVLKPHRYIDNGVLELVTSNG